MKQLVVSMRKLSLQRLRQNLPVQPSTSLACCVWLWEHAGPGRGSFLHRPHHGSSFRLSPVGVAWLTSPRHFLKCMPSRDFLTNLMQLIHKSRKEGKRKASVMPANLKRHTVPPCPQKWRVQQPGRPQSRRASQQHEPQDFFSRPGNTQGHVQFIELICWECYHGNRINQINRKRW